MAEWIISSSLLILVIIAVRCAFRGKIGLRIQYALWALVLLRLLVPFSLFSSPVSAANLVPRQIAADTPIQLPALHAQTGAATESPVTVDSGYEPTGTGAGVSTQDILGIVWLGGMGVTALVLLISNISFGAKLKRTRQKLSCDCAVPVYVCENLPTPCMFMGAIYVTGQVAADPRRLSHVLAHEYTHYRHGDGVWSALRCLCLAVHWYNPLVWWAAVLSKRDGELACDEGAIARVGEGERMDYGRTLIELTARTPEAKDLFCCATTMTGGRKNIKERIELIAKKPKNIISIIITVVLICAIAAGCSFGGADSDPVDKLRESIVFAAGTDGTVTMSYTVPDEVISLNLTGRLVYDNDNGTSFHDELPTDSKSGTYSADFQSFSELYIEVELKNGKIGEIDLAEIYKEVGMPLRGSSNMSDDETITFNVEGHEETFRATRWYLGTVSILVPSEGWQEEDTTDGSALIFTAGSGVEARMVFRHFSGSNTEKAAKQIETDYGCTVEYEPWMYFGENMGVSSYCVSSGKSTSVYAVEYGGDVYAAVCSYPEIAAEGWGTRFGSIAATMTFGTENKYAPTGLTPDTDIGVGVLLDYADDHMVIFHGYFGLFVYDLDRQQIVGAFDLQKTVGTTNIQGSEGAGVEVSADGKTILLYHYIEDGAPNRALYINTDDMSCTNGAYKELSDPFDVVAMTHPELSYRDAPYIQEGATLADLNYVDDDMVWSLFDNYFKN